MFDALVGQDIATAQIDVKSGVTLTSNAVNDALKQAAADFGGGAEAAPAVAGDPYTVKGMNKFTLYVEVEDGKIVSVSAPNNNETPGLGADMLTDDALSALVGAELATAQVDVKSGVTLTSDAINEALKQAAVANGIAVEAPGEVTAETTAEPAVEATESESTDAAVYDVTGFAPFKVEITLDGNGKIVSVTVPENSETPGLGADLIADQSIFDALVGQDIATAQIDVKSGVTLTSDAINEALKQAAVANGIAVEAPGEVTAETTAEPAVEATESESTDAAVYDVTGFAPFKVEITLDGNGKIVSVTVPENSETPGLGADLIADQSIFDALVGQDIATAQIDVKSGVTLTSDAINEALKQAAVANGIAVEAPGEVTAETTAEPAVEATESESTDAAVYDVTGFAPFKVEITLDGNGKIVSVTVPENSETPGLGADLIADQSIFDALVGQDIATAQIDVKSGVTLTSNAINDALGQAAKEVQ
ncbi:MAG: FMN-binding protein [Christensenellales bacterium]